MNVRVTTTRDGIVLTETAQDLDQSVVTLGLLTITGEEGTDDHASKAALLSAMLILSYGQGAVDRVEFSGFGHTCTLVLEGEDRPDDPGPTGVGDLLRRASNN